MIQATPLGDSLTTARKSSSVTGCLYTMFPSDAQRAATSGLSSTDTFAAIEHFSVNTSLGEWTNELAEAAAARALAAGDILATAREVEGRMRYDCML